MAQETSLPFTKEITFQEDKKFTVTFVVRNETPANFQFSLGTTKDPSKGDVAFQIKIDFEAQIMKFICRKQDCSQEECFPAPGVKGELVKMVVFKSESAYKVRFPLKGTEQSFEGCGVNYEAVQHVYMDGHHLDKVTFEY